MWQRRAKAFIIFMEGMRGLGELKHYGSCGLSVSSKPCGLLFFVWSSREGVRAWNKKAEEILGWREEEFLGADPSSILFSGKHEPQLEELIRTLSTNERRIVFLETHTKSSGPVGIWWQFTKVMDEPSQSALFFGLGFPGENSGWLLETIAAALQASIHMGLLLDEDYKILDVSPLISLFGPYEKVVGKTLDCFLPNFQAWRTLLHRIKDSVKKEQNFRLRCELQSGDGRVFPSLLKGVLLPSLSCFFVDVADLSKHADLERQLEWAYGRLKVLGYRLMEIQREERERIATELHDRFSQSLTLLLWKLKEIEKGKQSQRALMAACEEMRQLVEEIDNQFRNFITVLETSSAKEIPFQEALRLLVVRFQQHFLLPCSLTLVGDVPDLRGGRRATCFHIIREALLNVVRHAMATQVEVRLEAKRRWLHVLVADNGIGMSQEKLKQVRRSPGIRGMQRRATAVGGRLRITSKEGHGTEVLLILPLERT